MLHSNCDVTQTRDMLVLDDYDHMDMDPMRLYEMAANTRCLILLGSNDGSTELQEAAVLIATDIMQEIY